MKKRNLKTGFAFGLGMAVFFILQMLWTADALTTKTVLMSLTGGIVAGGISGLLFSLFIGFFTSSRFAGKIEVKLQPGEELLFQTVANHFKGMEGVGGKLFLTNEGVVFKSHKVNIQNHEDAIFLKEITSADRYKNMKILNNGLRIISKDNRVYKFVVEEAEEWIKKLKQNTHDQLTERNE